MTRWTRARLNARESEIEKYLKQRVGDTGGKTRKVRWLDKNGAPDRLVWWKFPHVCFVEVKAEGVEIDWDGIQGREAARLLLDGWPLRVINSREGVDALIREFTHEGG